MSPFLAQRMVMGQRTPRMQERHALSCRYAAECAAERECGQQAYGTMAETQRFLPASPLAVSVAQHGPAADGRAGTAVPWQEHVVQQTTARQVSPPRQDSGGSR